MPFVTKRGDGTSKPAGMCPSNWEGSAGAGDPMSQGAVQYSPSYFNINDNDCLRFQRLLKVYNIEVEPFEGEKVHSPLRHLRDPASPRMTMKAKKLASIQPSWLLVHGGGIRE
jgi:hypothetical protein